MSQTTKPDASSIITNLANAPEERYDEGPWGSTTRVLTPHMRERGGKLGVVMNTLKQGQVGCPFHHHLLEDEVFYVVSGRGVLRYGDTLAELVPGDCVSCPAGTGIAHQIANPYEEDLVYLAMGPYEKNEVCAYPDNGKVFVRGLRQVGFLSPAEYMAGEPDPPVIFALASASAVKI